MSNVSFLSQPPSLSPHPPHHCTASFFTAHHHPQMLPDSTDTHHTPSRESPLTQSLHTVLSHHAPARDRSWLPINSPEDRWYPQPLHLHIQMCLASGSGVSWRPELTELPSLRLCQLRVEVATKPSPGMPRSLAMSLLDPSSRHLLSSGCQQLPAEGRGKASFPSKGAPASLMKPKLKDRLLRSS